MKLRVFNIRLNKEHLHNDQEELNQFMEGVTVKKTSCQFINAQINYWSILVFYDQKTNSESRSNQSSKISFPIECKFQFNYIPPFQLNNISLDKDKKNIVVCC